jgi:hypothetical protein
LLAEKFLIDEAIENRTSILFVEIGDRAVGEKSFVAQTLIPIGLQDDVAVDDGDDAVDNFGSDFEVGGFGSGALRSEKRGEERDGESG